MAATSDRSAWAKEGSEEAAVAAEKAEEA